MEVAPWRLALCLSLLAGCCGESSLGGSRSAIRRRDRSDGSALGPRLVTERGTGRAVRVAFLAPISRLRGGAEDKVDGHCIGIDLGTTYSCVGVWQNGRVEIIANDQGNRITPSYVAWTDDDQRLIGDAAKNQAASNPENTVFDAKRLIGRKFDDPTVQTDMRVWPFKVVDKGGKPAIRINARGEKYFSPEEVSAMVLSKMKQVHHMMGMGGVWVGCSMIG